jgi:hypothetical protein
MNDLRKAAEMALKATCEMTFIWSSEQERADAIEALRQALTPEVTPEVKSPPKYLARHTQMPRMGLTVTLRIVLTVTYASARGGSLLIMHIQNLTQQQGFCIRNGLV